MYNKLAFIKRNYLLYDTGTKFGLYCFKLVNTIYYRCAYDRSCL